MEGERDIQNKGREKDLQFVENKTILSIGLKFLTKRKQMCKLANL